MEHPASVRARRVEVLKVYCNTDALLSNAMTEPLERKAVEVLVAAHEQGIIVLHRSSRSRVEVMDTADPDRRQRLLHDDEQLARVSKDERLYGFQTQDMGSLGFISSPLMSEVQNDALCHELESRGLGRSDAQHITQAVCNECDVFLTRDRKTIIRPHGAWLASRFPALKILLPSELVTQLQQAGKL